MDEEYFKTFSAKLLMSLLDDGLQVIILTHNDAFSRGVSFDHCSRTDFVTAHLSLSRKKGCFFQEGNRRVSERLTRARSLADDGELSESWKFIRLALERLYVLAIKKESAKFNPLSWVDQTAESMWNSGASDVIERVSPGIGTRLKEILAMAVAGAHDKAARGATDVLNAHNDIQGLLKALNVGD